MTIFPARLHTIDTRKAARFIKKARSAEAKVLSSIVPDDDGRHALTAPARFHRRRFHFRVHAGVFFYRQDGKHLIHIQILNSSPSKIIALYLAKEINMDLFRVETGTIPGRSCSEETMPMLKRGSKKDELPLNSKAFLIHDSLACIANITLKFAEPTNQAKNYPIQPTSPVRHESNSPEVPEYRQLSPKNLEDPASRIGENLPTKTIDNETSKLPHQPSTSSASLTGDSPPVSGKKKTLGELAKEWNANQNPGPVQVTAQESNESKSSPPPGVDDVDHTLVRHSTYYSTSSSTQGRSSHECRLENKLKARRHLNRNEVRQERKNSPPLIRYTCGIENSNNN